VDQVFAAQFAQVVGGLPDAVVSAPGHGVDLRGEVGDGEPAQWWGQGEDRREGGAGAGFVQVDTANPDGAELRRLWQLVEGAVGDEADVDAVQHGAEPFGHGGQAGDDGGELVQGPAAAELLGVVRDGLEAQHVFAFGVGLQRQQSEVDFEQGQVPPRCLDHDCQLRGQVRGAVDAGPSLGAEHGA